MVTGQVMTVASEGRGGSGVSTQQATEAESTKQQEVNISSMREATDPMVSNLQLHQSGEENLPSPPELVQALRTEEEKGQTEENVG